MGSRCALEHREQHVEEIYLFKLFNPFMAYMKHFSALILASLTLCIITKTHAQTSSNIDSTKRIEELAIKLSKSPAYISYMTAIQEMARKIVTGQAKSPAERQREDSLKKLGIQTAKEVPDFKAMEKLAIQLNSEVPELKQLPKETSRLVTMRANELLKANGLKFYTPSAPHNDNGKASDYDKVFTKTEQAPRFPGGSESFRRYLDRNLKKDAAALDGAPIGVYNVKVQFIIDPEGNVSNVKAIEVPKECPSCGAEAVKVIRKGPKWEPAVQNGRNVVFQNIETISLQVSAL
jgi:hypothetical protein